MSSLSAFLGTKRGFGTASRCGSFPAGGFSFGTRDLPFCSSLDAHQLDSWFELEELIVATPPIPLRKRSAVGAAGVGDIEHPVGMPAANAIVVAYWLDAKLLI